VEDAGILPNIEEYCEAIARPPISSVIDLNSTYDHIALHEDSLDDIAFQTTQDIYWPIGLVQRATDLVTVHIRVAGKKLTSHLWSIAEIFIVNIGMHGLKSQHVEDVIQGLPGVGTLVMDYLRNIEKVHADVKRAAVRLSGTQSNRYRMGVNIAQLSMGRQKAGHKHQGWTRGGIGPSARTITSARQF